MSAKQLNNIKKKHVESAKGGVKLMDAHDAWHVPERVSSEKVPNTASAQNIQMSAIRSELSQDRPGGYPQG